MTTAMQPNPTSTSASMYETLTDRFGTVMKKDGHLAYKQVKNLNHFFPNTTITDSWGNDFTTDFKPAFRIITSPAARLMVFQHANLGVQQKEFAVFVYENNGWVAYLYDFSADGLQRATEEHYAKFSVKNADKLLRIIEETTKYCANL